MADILSDGRVIFGVGRGYHTREVETFGAPLLDQAANRELFEEQVDIIFKAFNERVVRHKGKHYTLPPEVPYRGYTLKELTLVPRPARLPVECWQPIQGGTQRALDFMAKHDIAASSAAVRPKAARCTKTMVDFQAALCACRQAHRTGERLALGFQFYLADSLEAGMREAAQVLRREHEDVRRVASGARADRRADRDHASSEAGGDGEAAADRGCGEGRRLPDRHAGQHHRAVEEGRGALPRPDRVTLSLSVGMPFSEGLEQLEWFAKMSCRRSRGSRLRPL